jgi:hypothetical protein
MRIHLHVVLTVTVFHPPTAHWCLPLALAPPTQPGCLGRVTAEVYFDIPPWEVFRIFTNPGDSLHRQGGAGAMGLLQEPPSGRGICRHLHACLCSNCG